MDSDLNSHYLSVIDVEQWRLRGEEAASLGEGFVFAWDDGRQCLIAPATQLLAAEQRLFRAICAALGGSNLHNDYTNFDAICEAWSQAQRVVVLGQLEIPGVKCVCTHTLAEMLTEPKHKAAVWQLLRG